MADGLIILFCSPRCSRTARVKSLTASATPSKAIQQNSQLDEGKSYTSTAPLKSFAVLVLGLIDVISTSCSLPSFKTRQYRPAWRSPWAPRHSTGHLPGFASPRLMVPALRLCERRRGSGGDRGPLRPPHRQDSYRHPETGNRDRRCPTEGSSIARFLPIFVPAILTCRA